MLDRERFDVIHFHEPFVPFLSLVILRHSRAVNIATFHAYSGFSPSYEFGKRFMRTPARRLHGRIAVSAAAQHFIKRYFPGEYKVIPNGVDLSQYDDVPPFARWRDGIPNILFVGRFEQRKGLMYLLRAYYQLRIEGLGCRLLLVGSGPQASEARRYINSRRLGGVEVLGRLSDHDKARAFATADIYASPATGQESFGIVLLEAMAAGTPIVASDIHGYKGVVRRNEQAVLVPPRDTEALAAALGTLLRDPLLRERMGESGRRRAQQFGWENITAKVEDYYGFVIRRLAARNALPSGFRADIPEAQVRAARPRCVRRRLRGYGRVGVFLKPPPMPSPRRRRRPKVRRPKVRPAQPSRPRARPGSAAECRLPIPRGLDEGRSLGTTGVGYLFQSASNETAIERAVRVSTGWSSEGAGPRCLD